MAKLGQMPNQGVFITMCLVFEKFEKIPMRFFRIKMNLRIRDREGNLFEPFIRRFFQTSPGFLSSATKGAIFRVSLLVHGQLYFVPFQLNSIETITETKRKKIIQNIYFKMLVVKV